MKLDQQIMEILIHTPTYQEFKTELDELMLKVMTNEITKKDFDERVKALEEKYTGAFLRELDSRHHTKH